MAKLVSTTLLIFRVHLWSVLRSRRTLVCMVLASLPPMILVLAQRFGPSDASTVRAVAHIAWFLSLQVVVPLVALVAGSAVISEEIENRTITYVFTRPVPRAALLYGRLLATLLLVTTLLGASAWIVGRLGASAESFEPQVRALQGGEDDSHEQELGRRQRRREFAQAMQEYNERTSPQERAAHNASMLDRFLWASLFGGTVYSLLFAVLGVFLKHPMIFGLAYAFAIEVTLANLPGETQSLSVQHWLRGILVDPAMPIFMDLYLWELEDLPSLGSSLSTLGWVLVIGLILGGWCVRRRQYELTA